MNPSSEFATSAAEATHNTLSIAEPDTGTPADDTLRHWLALSFAPGVGAITFLRLLERQADLTHLFSQGDHHALPQKLQRYLRRPDWAAVDAALQWAQGEHCHILLLQDPRYPPLLKEIPDPPPILFVRGDPELLGQPQLAMVGSRNPSPSGTQLARDFAARLSGQGLIITSGLALGIDAASHGGALSAAGKTLAVAGTGLDRIYPARHRELGHHIVEQGALVSEFPPGTPPMASNFPRRNRIISGLSLGTLVVEAALQSGSLITARLAAEQGREVFALPGAIHNPLSRGCHRLIQEGAKLVVEMNDILEELGPLATFACTPNGLTAPPEPPHDQHPLLAYLGFDPISIDTLVEHSGLTPETVSSMLLTLEIQGLVGSSGGLYSRLK